LSTNPASQVRMTQHQANVPRVVMGLTHKSRKWCLRDRCLHIKFDWTLEEYIHIYIYIHIYLHTYIKCWCTYWSCDKATKKTTTFFYIWFSTHVYIEYSSNSKCQLQFGKEMNEVKKGFAHFADVFCKQVKRGL